MRRQRHFLTPCVCARVRQICAKSSLAGPVATHRKPELGKWLKRTETNESTKRERRRKKFTKISYCKSTACTQLLLLLWRVRMWNNAITAGSLCTKLKHSETLTHTANYNIAVCSAARCAAVIFVLCILYRHLNVYTWTFGLDDCITKKIKKTQRE